MSIFGGIERIRSIGAMIREAEFSQSKTDFVYKMTVALKKRMKLNIGYY
jgi:hypothetical protein